MTTAQIIDLHRIRLPDGTHVSRALPSRRQRLVAASASPPPNSPAASKRKAIPRGCFFRQPENKKQARICVQAA